MCMMAGTNECEMEELGSTLLEAFHDVCRYTTKAANDMTADLCDGSDMCFERDDNVADIYVVVERAGDAGIDQMGDAEAVDQDLRADRGVDLAYTAFDDDNLRLVQASDVKFHAGFFKGLRRSHLFCSELFDFKIHSADNADFHFCFVTSCAVMLCSLFRIDEVIFVNPVECVFKET